MPYCRALPEPAPVTRKGDRYLPKWVEYTANQLKAACPMVSAVAGQLIDHDTLTEDDVRAVGADLHVGQPKAREVHQHPTTVARANWQVQDA